MAQSREPRPAAPQKTSAKTSAKATAKAPADAAKNKKTANNKKPPAETKKASAGPEKKSSKPAPPKRSAGTTRASRDLDAFENDLKEICSDAALYSRRDSFENLDKKLAELKGLKGVSAARATYLRGRIHHELARKSGRSSDTKQARDFYTLTAKNYPKSALASDALLSSAALSVGLGEDSRARKDLQLLIGKYPKSKAAAKGKELLAELADQKPAAAKPRQTADTSEPKTPVKSEKAAEKEIPAPKPSGTAAEGKEATEKSPARLTDLRGESFPSKAQVTLFLDAKTSYRYQVLGPGGEPGMRLYIDLDSTVLGKNISSTTNFPAGLLRKVRTSPFKPGVIRVVMEADDIKTYDVDIKENPYRIILSAYGTPGSRPKEQATAEQKAAKESPAAKKPAKSKGAPAAKKDLTPEEAILEIAKQKVPPEPDPFPPPQPQKGKKGQAGKKSGVSAKGAHTADIMSQLGLTVKTIVIDPGHGGRDGGAPGLFGLKEKDINLRMSLILAEKLRAQGYKVLMTRTRDVYLSLQARTAFANKNKADLFISVHCNAFASPTAKGMETYSLNLAKSKGAVRVAARENSVDPRQISDLQLILTDLMLTSKIKESRDLAKIIQTRTVSNAKKWRLKDHGAQEAPLYVLMGAKMPAVLLELGYITNRDDAGNLQKKAYLDNLATGIVLGVNAYKVKLASLTR